MSCSIDLFPSEAQIRSYSCKTFFAGWMLRPISTRAAEIFEEYVDTAITLIQSRVEGELQARHNGEIVRILGAL